MEAVFVLAAVLCVLLTLCMVCAVAVVRAQKEARAVMRAAILSSMSGGGGRSRKALAEELDLERFYNERDDESYLEREPSVAEGVVVSGR